ncbi:hypothetical protein M422DRAFT_245766 [Sphaerobolus stellatus SS14]|nr:hypothetical protein M422DRAFT_245766 [Sphaerobolus stellatus SS14]
MDVFGTVGTAVDLAGRIITYIKAVKGGREERENLQAQLVILRELLPMLDNRLQSASADKQFSPGDLATLMNSYNSCHTTLEEISLKLEHAQRSPKGKLLWPFSKGDVVEKIRELERFVSWAKIVVDVNVGKTMEQLQKDVGSLRSQVMGIEDSVQTTSASVQTASADIVHIKSSLNVQKLEELASWLSDLEYAKALADNLDVHTKETSNWIFNTPELDSWRNGNQGILWCYGDPGVGKTMIASLVIKDLRKQYQTRPVLYIYCNYQSQLMTRAYLEVLLKQLLQQSFITDDAVIQLTQMKVKGKSLSRADLQGILVAQLHHFAGTFIVLDAFDEILDETIQDDLLAAFDHMVSHCHAHVMITSRHHVMDFKKGTKLEITAMQDDLEVYIKAEIYRMKNLHNLKLRVPDIEETIIKKVYEKSSSIFLLAKLHMVTLDTKARRGRPSDILTALDDLHNNFENTCEDILKRIDSEDQDIFHLILSWILLAYRPLSMEELQNALQVTERQYTHDPLQYLSKDLIHETASQFLKHYIGHSGFLSRTSVAKSCISFLDANLEQQQDIQTIAKVPFTSYAAGGWVIHIANIEEQEVLQQCAMLLNSAKFPAMKLLLLRKIYGSILSWS